MLTLLEDEIGITFEAIGTGCDYLKIILTVRDEIQKNQQAGVYQVKNLSCKYYQ